MLTIRERPAWTPGQIATRLGVGRHKVAGWILSGQLRAVNVATSPAGRPRYRVLAEDLADFEAARLISPRPPRRRSARRLNGITRYV